MPRLILRYIDFLFMKWLQTNSWVFEWHSVVTHHCVVIDANLFKKWLKQSLKMTHTSQGIFCPSLGANFGPIPIIIFFPIPCLKSKKKKIFFFYFFFRDHFYLWETMTNIRMIFKHLCLSSMFDIKQSKITGFWGYILLPLLCSMLLISPNFDVKWIIFSQFCQNCWKKPCICNTLAKIKKSGVKFWIFSCPSSKRQEKNASENVVCWSHLLQIIA